MNRKELEILIASESEKRQRRDPVLSKVISAISTGIVVSVIVGGFVCMRVFFPEIRVSELRYKLAGFGFMVLAVVFCILFHQSTGWILRRREPKAE